MLVLLTVDGPSHFLEEAVRSEFNGIVLGKRSLTSEMENREKHAHIILAKLLALVDDVDVCEGGDLRALVILAVVVFGRREECATSEGIWQCPFAFCPERQFQGNRRIDDAACLPRCCRSDELFCRVQQVLIFGDTAATGLRATTATCGLSFRLGYELELFLRLWTVVHILSLTPVHYGGVYTCVKATLLVIRP